MNFVNTRRESTAISSLVLGRAGLIYHYVSPTTKRIEVADSVYLSTIKLATP